VGTAARGQAPVLRSGCPRDSALALCLALVLTACAPVAAPPASAPTVLERPTRPTEALPSPPASPPPAPPEATLDLATLHALLAALAARDASALPPLYAEAPDVSLGPGNPTIRNGDDIAKLAAAAWAMFPDAKVQWGLLVQSGDTIVVELAWTGTRAGMRSPRLEPQPAVGQYALLMSRFAKGGKIASQSLYLDVDEASFVGTPRHDFAGLPTSQSSLADGAPSSAEDVAPMQSFAAALGEGRIRDTFSLASKEVVWSDVSTGRTVSGAGAMAAWAAMLAKESRSAPLRARFIQSGDVLVCEWAAVGQETGPARGVDVVRWAAGHIALVRSYRPSAKGGAKLQRGAANQ
jgi:SnoaL-like domain